MNGNQTTILNEVTLSEMTDLVRREWHTVMARPDEGPRTLFMVSPVGAGQGSSKRFNEYDTETYADYKAEGTNSTKSKVGIGYSKDMNARTFSKEIDITLEMRNDNRYREVGTAMTDLSMFCRNRQSLDLTHRFTFGTAASYTDKNGETVDTSMGDGFALLYSAHTLVFSSTTYRNRVSGDPVFSQGAYEAALLLAATNIYSNFGEKRTMDFNTIVTGNDPSTMRAVKQLLTSTADVDGAQSGLANVYAGFMRHIVLKDLATTAAGAYDSTKRRWWMIVAAGQWQAHLGEWIQPTLVTPSNTTPGMDIHNYNWTYSAYARWGIVITSGRGVVGAAPVS